MPKSHRSLHALACTALALAASCTDVVGVPTTPVQAAGEYQLASVSGRGPTSGRMTLRADGSADRIVAYGGTAPGTEYYYIGTYQLDAQGVVFKLREAISALSYEWPVRGEWEGNGFSIRYPDPADGPDIVETYLRR